MAEQDKRPGPGQEPERQRGRDAPTGKRGATEVRPSNPPAEANRQAASPLPPVGEPPPDDGRDSPSGAPRNARQDDHTSATHRERDDKGVARTSGPGKRQQQRDG